MNDKPAARGRRKDGAGTTETKLVYTAPALEKGLDILELLAREEYPLTASAIVQKLGRSTGELFRMIQVLERRGFVSQDSQGYSLTSRLFEMGLERPPIRNLIEIALPVMRRLSNESGQSCLLSFHSEGETVVVARMEAREQLGFTVRVGYRKPLYTTTSGATLYAFQPDDVRAQWETLFKPAPKRAELLQFRTTCDTIHRQGYAELPSGFIDGITDLSAPILRGNQAAAAISVPFVHSKLATVAKDEVIKLLREAARTITGELMPGDNRI
ncbi:IclR family transcriptional regulator [Sphingomonas sp. PR090111-T3T-6A]|uniref:IclR family transcriptional regulator n=1 Tax=Sphingomonas sp. PR090111-T3T-6A TaxID=685778 RepID=UPI000380AFF2|nr:IclR family transcriptional regulator [Sphingomonas sp. PR090111-T3T-6A]